MKCGRSKCRTPLDDVQQIKAMTLCRTHRAMALEVMSAFRAKRPKMRGTVPVIVTVKKK